MTVVSSRSRQVSEKPQDIRPVLEQLYEKYSRRALIKPDPLQFVYEYSKPADMEVAGFLAASLAYGRVEQIENSVKNLLGRMGKSPYDFILNFKNRDRAKLSNFKHRFNTGDDIADLLLLLGLAIAGCGSIEKYFMKFYDDSDENVIPALSRFCDSLLEMWHGLPARVNTAKMAVPRGLKFLIAGPNLGGAAKRLNMFLRWMVRKDDVDPGLWRSIDKSKLIVPVDVHINRLCKILGFHNRANVSMKTAIEITRRFAEIEPTDPVKYDFSLSRIGIIKDCTGNCRAGCQACELLSWCRGRGDWKL